MPRPASITFEDVSQCAESLLARGLAVTARAVRAELGSGSSQTVTALLRQWRNRQGTSPSREIELDPAITRAINAYVTQAVSAAIETSEARIVSLDADLADSLKEQEILTETLATRDQALEELQSEKATQAGRIEQMLQEMDGLRKELSQTQATAAAAQVALGKAEMQVEALTAYRTEAEKLRTEVEKLRLEAAGLHEAAAVAEARLEAEIRRREAVEASARKSTGKLG